MTDVEIDRRTLLKAAGAGTIAGTMPSAAAAGRDRGTASRPSPSGGSKTQLVVRFEETAGGPRADVDTLKARASDAGAELESFVDGTAGIEIRSQFWLFNGALVEVDRDAFDPDRLTALDGVDRIHDNFEVELFEGQAASDAAAVRQSTAVAAQSSELTYGLEQIGAPSAWQEYGTGSGARVAVLDTGVDGNHPDIDLAPDGWAEFDAEGNRIDSDPYDTGSHGTHVSGTVSGPPQPAGDVPRYGVAPDVELLHGLVLRQGLGGTFAQIVAGMQWAVEQDADVINMSLGGGTDADWIEPVRNTRQQGVVVVAASGNSGEGETGSPGDVYEAFAVGASDESEAITDFSNGAVIDTQTHWDGEAPDEWPDEYVVPNVAAPGSDVLSSVPGGEYDGSFSGTSMASPHVAGLVALMVSAAGGDVAPDELEGPIEATARKPDDWDDPDDEPDNRYGYGIVDAAAAVGDVAIDSGIEGTVTDGDGTGIADASVEVRSDWSTRTDIDGSYAVRVDAGDYEVAADAFGYERTTESVSIGDGTTTQSFELADAVDARVVDDAVPTVEGGDSVTVSLFVANADSITVDLQGGYDVDDATLRINGESASFGSSVPVEGNVLAVDVETTSGTEGTVSLSHEIEGLDDSVVVETGATDVFPQVAEVGVVTDLEFFDTVLPRWLDDVLPDNYVTATVRSDEVIDDLSHDVYVVGNLQSEEESTDFAPEATGETTRAWEARSETQGAAEQFITTTDEQGIPTVYLEQFGGSGFFLPPGTFGVSAYAEITGDPDPEGVDADFDGDEAGLEPISYTVEADHPVFGDRNVGDQVVLHEDQFAAHAWFGDTDLDVLASVATAEGTAGSGLAVDEAARTVLASSLGPSGLSMPNAFTAEGEALLGDVVTYLADGGHPLSAYVDENGVVDTAGLRTAVGDWRTGEIDTEVLQSVLESWGTGDPIL